MSTITSGDLSSDLGEYDFNIQQLEMFQTYGPIGTKIVGEDILPRSWTERIQAYFSTVISTFSVNQNSDFYNKYELIKRKVRQINHVHKNISEFSPCFKSYFAAARIVNIWNKQFGVSDSISGKIQKRLLAASGFDLDLLLKDSLRINYAESLPVVCPTLPGDLFTCSFLNGDRLPLVVSPKDPNMSLSSLQEWANAHQEELKSLISKYGALLLRDFPIQNAEEFAAILKAVQGKDLMTYAAGEGSRKKVALGVYTSTEAPSRFKIPLHNELTCTDSPATYISFYCEVAPKKGSGQTILASTERVTQAIRKKPEIWNLFENRTIKYISRHPPEGSLFNKINVTHKTWQNSFETEDKAKVAEICKSKRFECKWIGDWVEVTRRACGTKENPDDPKHPYWYNQAYLYHGNPIIRGGWINHLFASLIYFRPQTRQYDVEFDDGLQIPKEAVYEIYKILDQETVKFDWKQHDMLIVDNLKALHGRAPYEGDRRILTSLVR